VNLAERERKLQEIAKEIKICDRCDLHLTRTNSVPGEGPADAEILLVGEAPGVHEDQKARPFVGSAGHFLDELLGKASLTREQVFITNIVKSRPPGNRDPKPAELEACTPWLDMQIELIDPLVIVTLGRFSMAHFLPTARISEAHGKAEWVNGRMVVAMYHPAAALYQKSLRSTLESDFAKLPRFIEEARKAGRGTNNTCSGSGEDAGGGSSSQMSLF
jgi:uracil-DNA glycosylase